MNNINKIRIFILVIVIFFCFQIAYADIPNPDYPSESCNPGETMVTCRYNNINSEFNECKKYENDSNYRFLENSGSATAGEARYCKINGSKDDSKQTNNIIKTGIFVGVITVLALVGIVLLKKNVHS
ncbi:MAG: hypothetical protein PHN37_02870 [Candidatus Pacebacteria bacterium]|nr:hypothetical protein [Candidatus Paceibacterota bacterium]